MASIFQGIGNIIHGAVEAILGVIGSIWSLIVGIFGTFFSAIEGLLSAVFHTFEGLISTVLNVIGDIVGIITGECDSSTSLGFIYSLPSTPLYSQHCPSGTRRSRHPRGHHHVPKEWNRCDQEEGMM